MSFDPTEESAAHVLDILAGRCKAQAVCTAAALGIPDRLESGPRSASDLARDLACDSAALERLLDFLACLGFCTRGAEGTYALTALGRALGRDSLGPLAAFLGAPEMWNPWSSLRQVIASGDSSAFTLTHGAGLYDYLQANPAAARGYDAAIDAFTRHEARTLGEHFDFSAVDTVVDVGGGRGAALVILLTRWPRMRGILYDLPHVARAARTCRPPALAHRLEVMEGDFQQAVPTGADAYLLKHVLHNWDDASAAALLRRCVDGLLPHGKVLVIEAILSPHDRTDTARLLDLEMMVLTGGRQRRKPDLRRLFHAVGLVLEQCKPLTAGTWLLVGAPRG